MDYSNNNLTKFNGTFLPKCRIIKLTGNPIENFTFLHICKNNKKSNSLNLIIDKNSIVKYCNLYSKLFLENAVKLKVIIFDNRFNKNVDDLPNGLTCLIFGLDFNNLVDNLPEGLEYLRFGKKFNQPIDNLPRTLQYLFLGEYFDQSINNLPENLQYVNFPQSFSQKSNIDLIIFNSKYLIGFG